MDWSDWLTIAAFLMSSATWILVIIQNRKSIKISVVDFADKPPARHLFLSIENQSRLPVSITSIYVGKDAVRCYLEPQRVKSFMEKTGDQVTYSVEYKTLEFPIYLLPLGAKVGYVEPERPLGTRLVSGEKLSLLVKTNRGSIRKTVLLPPMGRYLRIESPR